ncbi:DUF6495 family protein [Tenacibaculum sp. UWU-22]|uniref:DUF6495 family protein n=1 Tax=Tenacibaculum sp. UWU-22 TaxID=3234187 RepID=UPI0034DB0E0B
MKYKQLTKEQLESLHDEFARFLATQQIDAAEWKSLKNEKPQIAEEELNIFSDIVWNDVLTKTNYLEHFSAKTINLFKCKKETIHRIVIKVSKNIDLQTQKDYQWLLKNPLDKTVEFLQGEKKYTKERNVEVFDLIEKGSTLSKGELFEYFYKLIEK